MFLGKKGVPPQNPDNKNEKIFPSLIKNEPKKPEVSQIPVPMQTSTPPKAAIIAPPSTTAPVQEQPKQDLKVQDFFSMESKTSPKPKEEKEEKEETAKPLLDKILSLTSKVKKEDNSAVLGAPPLELKTLGIKEYRDKKILKIVKTILISLAFIFFSILVYFNIRLNPSISFFGSNISTTLTNSTEEIKNLQTDINKNNFLSAKLKLDIFTSLSDKYNYLQTEAASSFIDSEEKRALELELADLKKELISTIKSIKDLLSEKIWIATKLEREIDTNLDLENEYRLKFISSLENDNAELILDRENNIEEIKIIENTIALANNSAFVTALQALNFDNITDQLLEDAIKLLNENSISDFSEATKIKNLRVNFSEIIYKIDEITKTQDITYGRGLYNELGGIRYNTYTFESKSRKISLNGETKTDDGKNFTLTANLLDALENSKDFKNVTNGSYSKNLVEDENKFTSNFTISLELQGKDEIDPRDNI